MIERLRVGDDLALAAIYDRYGRIVNGIAHRFVGPALAPDVTQDVFLSLWEHPGRYKPDVGGLRAYLAVAARRRSIDVLRSEQRRKIRERRADDGAPAAPARSVETTAVQSVVAERVRAAIGCLQRDQRTAIELAYLKGLTFRQVADAMGTAEGTAKSRLRLGLARLARELSAEGSLSWN